MVEHPEVVAERIEGVADSVGDSERIVAGVDCGFETFVEGANAIHPDILWKKLEALIEATDLAAERLA